MPFRQVRERGFECHDDGAPLRCLVVRERDDDRRRRGRARAAADGIRSLVDDPGFDIADEEYAEIVARVIADEIGRGEGANFVIRRDFTAGVGCRRRRRPRSTWFRALLEHERGAYWTFAIVTPGHIAVGASPEAHVARSDGSSR